MGNIEFIIAQIELMGTPVLVNGDWSLALPLACGLQSRLMGFIRQEEGETMLIPQVENHPVEDVLGEEILSGDHYFELPNGEVINSLNAAEYLIKNLKAIEKQAK